MLWPLVLPAQITLALIVALVLIGTLLAPAGNLSRRFAFLSLTGVGIVVFIPSCTLVMQRVDATRFGEFFYADFTALSDSHASRYIPSSATNIQTYQQANGIWATFDIAEQDLVSAMKGHWDRWGEQAVNRSETWVIESDEKSEMQLRFANLNWDLPQPSIILNGPVNSRGAGYQVWYDRDKQRAALWGGYW